MRAGERSAGRRRRQSPARRRLQPLVSRRRVQGKISGRRRRQDCGISAARFRERHGHGLGAARFSGDELLFAFAARPCAGTRSVPDQGRAGAA